MATSQTFSDHIHELRRRILWIALAVIVSASIAYAVREPVIDLLQAPLDAPLYYSSPAGSFNFIVKLSMIIGMFVGLPILIYHAIRFAEPALPMRITKFHVFRVICASCLLAAAGIAFGYLVIVPQSLHFFGGYSSDQIQPLISADEYLKYVLNIVLTFAIVFQIPLFTLFINKITPLKPAKLLKYQRHVVVGALAIALVLPFTYDPLTQFAIAIPIVVLYYFSIVLLLIVNRGRRYEPAVKPDTNKPDAPKFVPEITTPVVDLVPQLRPLTVDGFFRPASATSSVNRTAQVVPSDVKVRPVKQGTLPKSKYAIDGVSRLLPSSI